MRFGLSLAQTGVGNNPRYVPTVSFGAFTGGSPATGIDIVTSEDGPVYYTLTTVAAGIPSSQYVRDGLGTAPGNTTVPAGSSNINFAFGAVPSGDYWLNIILIDDANQKSAVASVQITLSTVTTSRVAGATISRTSSLVADGANTFTGFTTRGTTDKRIFAMHIYCPGVTAITGITVGGGAATYVTGRTSSSEGLWVIALNTATVTQDIVVTVTGTPVAIISHTEIVSGGTLTGITSTLINTTSAAAVIPSLSAAAGSYALAGGFAFNNSGPTLDFTGITESRETGGAGNASGGRINSGWIVNPSSTTMNVTLTRTVSAAVVGYVAVILAE